MPDVQLYVFRTSCAVRHSPSHPLKCKRYAAAGRRRRISMASCHRRQAIGRSQSTEASATSKTNSSNSSPFRLELKFQIGPHKNDEQFYVEYFLEKKFIKILTMNNFMQNIFLKENSSKFWRRTNHQEKRHWCTVRLSNQNTLFYHMWFMKDLSFSRSNYNFSVCLESLL